jgi:hypothetical protein
MSTAKQGGIAAQHVKICSRAGWGLESGGEAGKIITIVTFTQNRNMGRDDGHDSLEH